MATNHLVVQLWQELLVFEEFHNDCISKAKASTGLVFAPKGLQQLVIPAASSNGAQLPFSVPCLKHNA